MTWGKDKEETGFILFLEHLTSMEFDLPMLSLLRSSMDMLIAVVSTNLQKSSATVLSCSLLISTPNSIPQMDQVDYRCEYINGPAFLEDLKANQVQPCLINALCAVSARFSNHPALVTQPRYMSGASFAKTAREQCQLDRPIFRLYIIQTLALLALYSFSINEGAQAWFELGTFQRRLV
jgi:Fungal specific transcription factor domain